ncbi:hypothetical protein [Polymorphospora rubra]|uniref:hypothetical protein n=1 Tax=Polymorphospora rubra TaxID=338584 RepID=UPI0033F4CACD
MSCHGSVRAPDHAGSGPYRPAPEPPRSGSAGLVDIVSYRLVLWLFPMVHVLGLAIVLSGVAVLVARLTRLCGTRRAGAAVAGPPPLARTV